MIFQGYYNNPERYLFRFVLIEHADDYIAQGWEIVGMMQNTIFALNSVTSYVMAFNLG
jgi:hypothetical protein